MLAGLTAEQATFFQAMHEALMEVEMDRDYYKAVLEGDWPNADNVLAGFRKRGAERRNAQQEEPPTT